MKILILEKGFHGFGPMLSLLEQGLITNVQFLLHSEPSIKKEYEEHCSFIKADPYDNDVAAQFIDPWLQAWKKNTRGE